MSSPAASDPNHLRNSSKTTLRTSDGEWQPDSRGSMVPASGSYSSVLSSKLMPIGSHLNRSAEASSNKFPYFRLTALRRHLERRVLIRVVKGQPSLIGPQ